MALPGDVNAFVQRNGAIMVALKAEDMLAWGSGWEMQRIKGCCLEDLRVASWDWRMLCLPCDPWAPHLLSCSRRT